jgi:hypothetical protein
MTVALCQEGFPITSGKAAGIVSSVAWVNFKGMLGRNPLIWMVEVNGLPYDIRRAPRKVQEEAVRHEIIPFVPGEEQDEVGKRR